MVKVSSLYFNLSFYQLCQNLLLQLPIILTLLLTDVPSSLAHIGQPCNLLGICWPPNLHIYCDDNKICQCRPETPVVVGPHQCKRNKSHGDKCSSDGECIFSDTNSICDSNQCNCKSNFTYDPYIMKCIHASFQQRSSFGAFFTMLSSAALWVVLILIALLISIPCCLAFMYHCVCYDNANTESSLYQESSIRLRLSETGFSNSDTTNTSNGAITDGENDARISLRNDDNSTRQSYELSSFDEPPPSYDEACKRTQTSPILSNDTDVADDSLK
ncbi:uncharacterized protein LOC107364806 isoform X1 [Tetranychus urticae]|nr:uncharacterized protein LOC107364806 isoform X1 [Tetranychus urticae]